MEAAQGGAEGSEPTCVLIRVAGHGASVAGITGISGETGPGQDEPVSGPSSGSVGHEAAAPGRVHIRGVVIPLYERWTYRHEFLTRGQRRGETVEEYFRAKRDLLMKGDMFRDMVAAYPAYWSGLRQLELVILMDALVLGHIWDGQILHREPQLETWAVDTAPDVGTL